MATANNIINRDMNPMKNPSLQDDVFSSLISFWQILLTTSICSIQIEPMSLHSGFDFIVCSITFLDEFVIDVTALFFSEHAHKNKVIIMSIIFTVELRFLFVQDASTLNILLPLRNLSDCCISYKHRNFYFQFLILLDGFSVVHVQLLIELDQIWVSNSRDKLLFHEVRISFSNVYFSSSIFTPVVS